jgi:hypothetical protein
MVLETPAVPLRMFVETPAVPLLPPHHSLREWAEGAVLRSDTI